MATQGANSTIGLRDVCYAMLVSEEMGPEYGQVQQVAGAIDVVISSGSKISKQYADDGTYDSYATLGDMYMTLEMAALPAQVQQDWLGFEIDSNGAVIRNKDAQGDYFALGFRSMKSDGNFKYVWLYKCKATIPEQKAHTMNNGDPTWSTSKVTLEVSPRKSDGMWQVSADEGAEGVVSNIGGLFFQGVYEANRPTAD